MQLSSGVGQVHYGNGQFINKMKYCILTWDCYNKVYYNINSVFVVFCTL